MAARLASAGLTFAVPMVLARLLAPTAYGTFKQAWLIASTLYFVLPMTTPQSLYYFVPREPERRAVFVGQALAFNLAMGLLGAGILLAAAPLLASRFHNPELAELAPWMALVTGAMLAGVSFDASYNAAGRIVAAAVVRVAGEGGRALAMVVGAVAFRSVRGLLAGIAVAMAVRTALCWFLLVREYGLALSVRDLRRQLAYAMPFGLAMLAIIPQQQFHQYAVGATVSAAAFAIYSVGCFQLPVVDILYTPISEILQLGIAEGEARGDPGHGLVLFREAVSRLAFAFIPCTVFLFLCAPEIVAALFTPRYLAAVPIFRISLLSISLAALPLDGVMRARAQNHFTLWGSIAKLAVTVPFVLAGLRAFGPVGAMAGWITAEALWRIALLWRTAALYRVGPGGVLPWRDLGRQAAAAMAAVPGAYAAVRLVPGPAAVRAAAASCAFAVVYAGIARLGGWLPLEALPRRRAAPAPSPVGAAVAREEVPS